MIQNGRTILNLILITFCIGLVLEIDGKNITHQHYASSFGSQFYHNTTGHEVVGPILVADPIHACESLNMNATGYILLIERTLEPGCSFVEKVLNAQYAGASAAIVFNRVTGVFESPVFVMSYDKANSSYANVTIPNLSVVRETGLDIRKFASSTTSSVTGYISKQGMLESLTLLESLLQILVMVVSMVLLFGFLFGIMRLPVYYLDWQRKIAAKKLLPYKYNDIDVKNGLTQDNCCSVCLDELARGQTVKKLPCGHVFHHECIDSWLIKKKALCPVCRKGIFENDDLNTVEEARFRDIDLVLDREETSARGGNYKMLGCFVLVFLVLPVIVMLRN